MTDVQPNSGQPSTDMTPGRRETATLLNSRSQWRASIAVNRISRFPWLSALIGGQAALASTIVLLLVHMSPYAHLTGYAALGTMVALFGRFAPGGKRMPVLMSCAFWQCFGILTLSVASCLGVPPVGLLVILAGLCGVFFFVTVTYNFGPPGALIFVFAAGSAMVPVDDWSVVVERGAAAVFGSAVAVALCTMTERLRKTFLDRMPPIPVDAIRPWRARLVASLRLACAALLAAELTRQIGAAHPAWAAMGVVAVLQGAHLHVTMSRAVQRMLGTMAGAVLIWPVLVQEPSLWTVVILLALAQILAELVIGANYAFTQVMVTPMALLMSYLVAGGAAGAEMAPERVLDTVIGAGLGLLFSVIFSTLDERVFLAAHMREHALRDGVKK